MDRTACFIDGGYFQNVLRYFGEPRIDFQKLAWRMKGDGQLLRAYYYNCRCLVSENPTEEELDHQNRQERFFYKLQTIPQFECKFGTLEMRPREDGTQKPVQKQVDVMMALDIAKLSWKHLITKASIIAGDADLIPAIQSAKDEGVVVELFYSGGTVSREILQTVDIPTEITFDVIEAVKLIDEYGTAW